MQRTQRNFKKLRSLACLTLVALLVAAAAAQDFGVDRLSPEVPARTPSDIYNPPGTAPIVVASQLGLNPGDEVDAMSYGHDQITPLGPINFVTILYSVTRGTQGLRGGAAPGAGTVNRQVMSNGAAGDRFFLRAVGTPFFGMVPIARGLQSDAPMHNLTPLPNQSDLDQMSRSTSSLAQPVYFSVDPTTAAARGWQPADILRVTPVPLGSPPPTPTVWATAAQLGLTGLDINALALRNRGDHDALDAGDVVWVSLSGRPTVLQVWPPPQAVVFTAANLALLPTDDLNALTGWDPGVSACGERLPPLEHDAVFASLDVLSTRIVLEQPQGPLPEVVSALQKLADRRFRIAQGARLPNVRVKLPQRGAPLGEFLQGVLDQADWTYEVSHAGDVVLCPVKGLESRPSQGKASSDGVR